MDHQEGDTGPARIANEPIVNAHHRQVRVEFDAGVWLIWSPSGNAVRTPISVREMGDGMLCSFGGGGHFGMSQWVRASGTWNVSWPFILATYTQVVSSKKKILVVACFRNLFGNAGHVTMWSFKI